MTIIRSTCSLSATSAFSNSSVNFSPKNVISGYITGVNQLRRMEGWTLLLPTFMIQGGYIGPSSSSSLSSHLLPPLFRFRFGRGGLREVSVAAQAEHTGTSPDMMDPSMTDPGTRARQARQDAVAKLPWHCITLLTPVNVSRVSMFCV